MNLVAVPIEEGVDPSEIDWKGIISGAETFNEIKKSVMKAVKGESVESISVEEEIEKYEKDNKAIKSYLSSLKRRAEAGDGEALEEYNEFAEEIPGVSKLTTITERKFQENQEMVKKLRRKNQNQEEKIGDLENQLKKYKEKGVNPERVQALQERVDALKGKVKKREERIEELEEEAQNVKTEAGDEKLDKLLEQQNKFMEQQSQAIEKLSQSMSKLAQRGPPRRRKESNLLRALAAFGARKEKPQKIWAWWAIDVTELPSREEVKKLLEKAKERGMEEKIPEIKERLEIIKYLKKLAQDHTIKISRKKLREVTNRLSKKPERRKITVSYTRAKPTFSKAKEWLEKRTGHVIVVASQKKNKFIPEKVYR